MANLAFSERPLPRQNGPLSSPYVGNFKDHLPTRAGAGDAGDDGDDAGSDTTIGPGDRPSRGQTPRPPSLARLSQTPPRSPLGPAPPRSPARSPALSTNSADSGTSSQDSGSNLPPPPPPPSHTPPLQLGSPPGASRSSSPRDGQTTHHIQTIAPPPPPPKTPPGPPENTGPVTPPPLLPPSPPRRTPTPDPPPSVPFPLAPKEPGSTPPPPELRRGGSPTPDSTSGPRIEPPAPPSTATDRLDKLDGPAVGSEPSPASRTNHERHTSDGTPHSVLRVDEEKQHSPPTSGRSGLSTSSTLPPPDGPAIVSPRPLRFNNRHPLDSAFETWRSQSSHTNSDPDEDEREKIKREMRYFPPLLPANPFSTINGRTNARESKGDMTNKISSVVSRLEKHAGPDLANASSDSDSESDYRRFALEQKEHLQKLWSQLKQQREELYNKRLRMATARQSLRDLRSKKDEADNFFMGLVRETLVKDRTTTATKGPTALDKAFEKMQNLRSEYHERESKYEGLEVSLDEQEENLSRTEIRFFSELALRRGPAPESVIEPKTMPNEADAGTSAKECPELLRGITAEGPREEFHPLYRDLQDAIGDFTMAHEEYCDLLREKERIDYEVDLNKRLGRPTDEEDAEFLGDFVTTEQIRRDELERSRSEVLNLRKLCQEKGVMVRHLPFWTEYIFFKFFPLENQADIGEDLDLLDARTSQPPDIFPRLLTQRTRALGNLKKLMKAGAPDSANLDDGAVVDGKAERRRFEASLDLILGNYPRENTSRFINRWLFNQLEISPRLAHLLHDTFTATGLTINNTDQWQQDVIDFWWRDEANWNEDLRGPLTAPLTTNPSIKVHRDQPPTISTLSIMSATARSAEKVEGLGFVRSWSPLVLDHRSIRSAPSAPSAPGALGLCEFLDQGRRNSLASSLT